MGRRNSYLWWPIRWLYCIIFFARKRKIKIIKLLDIIAPSLLVGQMLGRWGNFFNHEAYGGEVSRSYLENRFIPKFIIR